MSQAIAETWQNLSHDGLRAADEGRFKDAETLFRQAHELGATFDQSDPRQATSINNLAYALHANGNYGDAVDLYLKAISLREATLGRDHPDIADARSGTTKNRSAFTAVPSTFGKGHLEQIIRTALSP